jgi:NTP pyrophosphatase (non-canonical NTP hydrolase)
MDRYDPLANRTLKVRRFSDLMLEVICKPKNVAKGDAWTDMSVEEIAELLNGELDEFERAIKAKDNVQTHLEGADVAIYTMFLCDKVKRL